MSDTTIPPLKRCTKCGAEYPATFEFFYRRGGGFRNWCRDCTHEDNRKHSKKWRERNAERVKEYRATYRLEHAEELRAYSKKRYHDNPEYYAEQNRRWRANNAERESQRKKQWWLTNRENMIAKRKGYYARNIANQREYNRIYNQRRREQGLPPKGNYETRRVTWLRRRARLRALPNTLTAEQWQRAINYFNGCCAVCGRQTKDLFGTHTLAADHWIPITHPNCPGTVAANIIPLCHGEDGCNSKKSKKSAEEWLIAEFGKSEAKKTLKRINAYFEWVKSQDG